jgi:SAM-dependent methyltransferase
VLDIGSADGALFRALGGRIRDSVGIDPNTSAVQGHGFRLIRGHFPADIGDAGSFDVIVALAVLEHVPVADQPDFAATCHRLLTPGGRLIITVPSPSVDHIVRVLQWLRIAEGIEIHQHYGFEPSQTVPLFRSAGFTVARTRSFELGLKGQPAAVNSG